MSHKMKSHYRAVHARKKNTRRIYRRHPFGESGRSLEPRPPRAPLARPPCLACQPFIWPSSSAAWRGGKAAGLRSVRVKIPRVLECRCSASDRGVFVQCRVRVSKWRDSLPQDGGHMPPSTSTTLVKVSVSCR